TNLHSRHAGGNGAKRAAGGRAWFRVPALQLTQAAGHAHDEETLLLPLELLRDSRPGKKAEPGEGSSGTGAGHVSKETAARQEVAGGLAGVGAGFHGA